MRQVSLLAGLVTLFGINSVEAAAIAPGSLMGELIWVVLAGSAGIAVMAYEAGD